ncbi:MAG: hypothetical protein JJV97_05790 [SAR324 cluster bacterium]|nr:hypothetical protein [SAR324 cluster bacterium]
MNRLIFYFILAISVSTSLIGYAQPINLPGSENDQENLLDALPSATPFTSFDDEPALDALSLKIGTSLDAVKETPEISNKVKLLPRNLFTTWLRLSASGKNQAEIETHLSEVSPTLINRVKGKLRQTVLLRLKGRLRSVNSRSSLALKKSFRNIVSATISYYGLELDSLLISQITDEFGIEI